MTDQEALPGVGLTDEERRVVKQMERFTYLHGWCDGLKLAARDILCRLAERRFGESPTAEAAVDKIHEYLRLLAMIDRVPEAKGWDDLLATP